ncbi:MAG: S8 family peptidase [Chloroflexi bacterium]|nr:S8 family peptidase [Chloroflexota bacterium]PWB45706.1 MAG: hypothetical protein C3F10_05270 [Dehalococcoidia bacterium]
MADRNRPHIFVDQPAQAEPYTPPPRRITGRALSVPDNRRAHAESLGAQLALAGASGLQRRADTTRVEGALDGIYVTFESFPGIELAIESLDVRQGSLRPELRTVQAALQTDGQRVEFATVFIPDGRLGYFLQRVQQYLETVESERPRNSKLLDRVQGVALASIERLWTDRVEDFPAAGDVVWWEVWLRRRDGLEVDRLRSFAAVRDINVGPRVLSFPERLVVLARASATQLASALDVLDDLAELRAPRSFPQVLASETAIDQQDWVEQLVARTTASEPSAAAVCILDTGISHQHPLLAHSLDAKDCHACVPAWSTSDHHGHGTAMAGIALYGDLGEVILGADQVHLRHRLESVKLLPPVGANPPELYGALTATGASLVEIQAPMRRRLFSMAISASDGGGTGTDPSRADYGKPTSWSASIDALAAGLGVDTSDEGIVLLNEDEPADRRLFLICAGNVREIEDDHLARSDLEPVEDPAQAWNAVTVGAMTDLVTLDPNDQLWRDWTPVAPRGELSPFSRTSVMFGRNWPSKPDVVFEGGNAARSPLGTEFDWPDALQLLTTRRLSPDGRLLDTTGMTSAATAGVAHIGGEIIAEYPSLWPETVRALIVHSAEWTPAMLTQFCAADTRRHRVALRARYGMGVPSLERATRSASDALTLIVQDSIHPFDGDGKMREMHLHALPWPVEVLAEMGAAHVRLRVTLSYFVEPNPSRRGWRQRFRYMSHGLRFDVRRPTESIDEFRRRINKLARDEGTGHDSAASDAQDWFFGPENRVSGSIHSDFWEGTAAELAERGYVAIYPVSGWWKDRKERDHSDRGAPYALVVSIETPEQDVDLWTPVATEVGVPIVIEYE